MSTAAERLAALRARVAAAVNGGQGGQSGGAPGGGGSQRTGHDTGSSFGNDLASKRTTGLPPSGGLNVPLHPALENLNATFTPAASKFGRSGKNNGRRQGRANPYLDSSPATVAGADADVVTSEAEAAAAAGFAPPTAPAPRSRQSKQLVFNEKGKYIQQGIALRRQAALEAMKKRIADQARKAGMDEIPGDKNFAVEAPPDIEWIDQGYFAEGKTYDDLDTPGCLVLTAKLATPEGEIRMDTEAEGMEGVEGEGKTSHGEDCIITDLVQHPIPIEPPQDKLIPTAKPMYLTKKEQKKLRRQRRMADLKENQAKIRLGLMPAPPPKVKRSNLMRVLGEEAVQDPTAVEARVNREIANRFEQHAEVNESRKLTKEQRLEKLASNQDKDAAKGMHMLIFRIATLANGQHRFKIWKNAEQLALTGVCVMHPKACLVIVEGGEHSINKYRKLMMNRIDWTHNIPATMPPPAPVSAIGSIPDGNRGPAREWLANESESLPNNNIRLIFDGETKGRAFRKWSSKVCDTDREAFDFLARTKLESFWTQARSSS
ncbi:u4 u6 small nuclear ribonucleoprotein [Ophiostoma piceae UAMH 11346]|uniref:U4 u6 small nuclear ribonucleoprotein n=1 Tax=Ophiostoma piceae (strain UAMH 11346) TaxID=1262450 RepID=S3CU59_OPHP1|nr:u4 u6 small nuclear ribonucleoprotein [Ophiostoma piceae UAMH 11346]